MNQCAACGHGFPAKRRTQRYCGRTCQKNAARAAQREQDRSENVLRPTEFIGVDGEGWTDDLGEHHYSQLSVGTRTLFRTEHLDAVEIFEFLWAAFEEHPRAAFVGFYLGYDFSQWFRTLPEEVAHSLLAPAGIAARRRRLSGGNTVPFPVRYGEWEFDILGNKRFKLRRRGAQSWMYVCDTGPFFQTSFLTVIDPKKWQGGSPVAAEDYAIIAEGKARRADYSTAEQWAAAEADLTRYNVAENRALAQVMALYEEGLHAVGVKLERDQWYGPGQAAQAWMLNVGMTERKELEQQIPDDVFDFARESYYGGRFEVFAHGHVPGPSYEYDLNSAYPHAMSVMPEWGSCEFEWVTGTTTWQDVESTLGLVDVTTSGSDPVAGGLAHRTRNGSILYPLRTRGVRWNFEVKAALEAGLVDTVTVHRALLIRPRAGSVLNAEIPLIYQRRLEVGKETSSGKAMKLIYNSAYGKQAQSVGSPRFSNPLSASFITAHCRATILGAISTHPRRSAHLLMIATDGVYFRSPHPGLSLSETELGKWSSTELSNLTIVMPGVYYHDAGRRALSAGSVKVKSRGIPAASFAAMIERLDNEFNRLASDPTLHENWPVLNVPIKFKVKTPKAALNEGKWERAGTVERDVDRQLSTDPSSKRQGPATPQMLLFGSSGREPYLDDGAVRTYPYEEGPTFESKPYTKDFGIAGDREQWGFDQDGDLQTNLMELLNGA